MKDDGYEYMQLFQNDFLRDYDAIQIGVFKFVLCMWLTILTSILILVSTFGPANPDPDNVRDWRTSIVDGWVTMLLLVTVVANVLFAIVGLLSLLSKLGVPALAGAGAPLGRLGWAWAVLAAMNGVSYFVSRHRNRGGWNWDGGAQR